MQDYIRPHVRELASQLRHASLSMDVDAVCSTAREMDAWLEAESPGSMELGFWMGVLRFCARQNPDPTISGYLMSKSERLDTARRQRNLCGASMPLPKD